MPEPGTLQPVDGDPAAEETQFGALTICFDRRVLRPRQWTTAQSAWAADLLARSPEGPVLELCAGAGHIGLLAMLREARHLVMVDSDPVACTYARRNAAAAPGPGTAEVRLGRFEDVLDPDERFVGVIADPPWVSTTETGRFPEDPVTAIDGGVDGLDVAWQALATAAGHLTDRGWVLLQLGTTAQATILAGRLHDQALGLRPAEVREYEGRGVVVHLVRADR
jgi:release factor glutamine methyltransferase